MSGGWCEFYDMDSAGCAHCAGLSGPGVAEAGQTRFDEEKTDDGRKVVRIKARYAGRCSGCGAKFYAGDVIVSANPGGSEWQATDCCGSAVASDA